MTERHQDCCGKEDGAIPKGHSTQSSMKETCLDTQPANSVISHYRIDNMCCPTEQSIIHQRLDKEDYINKLDFQLMDRTLTVTHLRNKEANITAALGEIGFKPTQFEDKSDLPNLQGISTQQTVLLTLSGLSASAAELIHYNLDGNNLDGNNLGVVLLSLLAILCAGIPTYIKGWHALSQLNLNINALMSVAVTGALIIGQWPEAAMVMFLFALAEQLEGLSLGRARNAIHALMALTPDTADVFQNHKWITKPAREVMIEEIIRIKPGDLIPLDGVVIKGNSSVNQAAITGESIPIEKIAGDRVFAGTLNENGLLEVSVQSSSSNTTLSKITHAVEESQGKKAPTQRFIDRFAKVYTPSVFVVALLTAILPPLLLDQAYVDWIYKALVILVIACPCALVISTPVTVVSGLAAAARKGILIKGGEFLESAHRLTDIAFDKTGTLTQGKPQLVSLDAFNGFEREQALQLAASLAAHSSHPISQTIYHYFVNNAAKNAVDNMLIVDKFENLVGQGLTGEINNTDYFLGNHTLLKGLNPYDSTIDQRIETLEKEGNTVVLFGSSSEVIAIIAVADPIKATSRTALSALTRMGLHATILSGDNSVTANAIGKKLGIDNIQANLLPEQKLAFVDQAIRDGKIIAMVGDGINDAPAMAKSHIAIAMGAAGSDTALETADIALMDDDLNKIPALIKLSQKTADILKQNIFLALSIKIIFLGLTFTGDATLWMAVFANMGTSLMVIFNGLRIVRA